MLARSLNLFRQQTARQTTVNGAVPAILYPEYLVPPLKFCTAVSARPKRDKRRLPLFPDGSEWNDIKGGSAGDDAWVVGKYYLGVADGVGAWNTKENGRPGLWARLLMHYWAVECEERIQLWKVDRGRGTHTIEAVEEEKEVDIIPMLQRAYLRTAIEMENSGGWLGSTTACVALLQRSTLHVANLGDSRALVIRDGNFIFRTTEQQHWYDCPYQLGTNSVDTPLQDATSHIIKLHASDTILLATDGLSDNLWDEEIRAEVNGTTPVATKKTSSSSPPEAPVKPGIQQVADSLCQRARAVGEDQYGESPYMEKAIMEGLPFHGGKLDDISVIVARTELDEDLD